MLLPVKLASLKTLKYAVKEGLKMAVAYFHFSLCNLCVLCVCG